MKNSRRIILKETSIAQRNLEFLCMESRWYSSDDIKYLKSALKKGANPRATIRFEKNSFDYACEYNKSYEFLKTLAYAGCWFNPALEYRDSDEIRQLKKSKEDCSVVVVVLYGILKRRLNQPRDTTQMIALMIWEKRFG